MDKRCIADECLSGTGLSYTLSLINDLSVRAVFLKQMSNAARLYSLTLWGKCTIVSVEKITARFWADLKSKTRAGEL